MQIGFAGAALLAAAASAFFLTWLTLRYARRQGVIDVPSARSLHSRPTPRGGGVAIMLTVLCCLAGLWYVQVLELDSVVAIGGAGFAVGAVGFWDDHSPVSPRLRLAVHVLAAAWLLFWLGGFGAVVIGSFTIGPSWVTNLLGAIWIVWVLNLYNFMDGIDALAGVEAVTAGFGGALIYWLLDPGSALWLLPALLLASSAGFLYWNYPPARIFMGDIGSGFLGTMFAALSAHSTHLNSSLLWAWSILLGVFVVDASITLPLRVMRGHSPFEAHRSHAYQQAALKWGHRPVVLAVALINLVWLLPLAVAAAKGLVDGALALGLAYVPLIWIAVRLGGARTQ